MSLAGLGAFNPAAILPKEFAFEKFFNKKKKNDKLPKSVPLAAFSGTCGWRPTGAVPSQIRSFVERFPQEFRLSSMSKCVLPMAENGLPFVTPEPEALLPSPMLSTLNALKLLQGKGFDRWDAKARCEAEMLYSNGIQVEWVPFPSYTAWQQYMEGSAVQQQSALQPHIVDTALMFLQWLEGPQILREISAVLGTSDTAEGKLTGPVLHAILSEGGKALDAKFLELNRGQASHRADPVAALACRKRKLAQLKDLPGQQVSSKRKRVLTEEERLLGETSEDEGTTEIANAESESEESVQEQEVAPKPNEKKLWARAWKQGLAPSTWVALLQSTSCNTVILTRPLHCQVGFLLGALQVADSRIGVGEFVAVAFAPADPGEKPPESDVAGSAKWLTRVAKRHLAAHTLDLASEVYMAQRRQAAEQIGKAAPKAAPLTKRLRQLFKRVSDPMDLPPGVPAPAPVAGGVKFEPMLVIRVPEKPMKESEHDSEDDDPTSLDKEKLSRWNQRLMEKFSLKVAGSGNAGSLGVFATNELAAGRRLRIKGAWFNAEADVLAHIQTMPEMASRIVRVDFPSDSKWCLLPSLFGLLRPGSRGASACISFDCGRALSHGLQLEVKKAIASGKEITFAKAAAPKKAAKVKKKSK